MDEWILNLTRLGALSLNSYWLPLIVWTGFTTVILLILSPWRTLHPFLQCTIRSAMLMALPIGIILSTLIEAPFSILSLVQSVDTTVTDGSFHMFIPAAGPPLSHPPLDLHFWIGVATVGTGFLTFIRLVQLIREIVALIRFRYSLLWIEPEELGNIIPARFDLHRARYAISKKVMVPMTFGFIRPVIVVPAYLMQQAHDLQMALRHEHIHVQRRDYLWRMIEQIVAAFFVVHPLVGLLRRQLNEYRELACDTEVLADPAFDPRAYALLLYRIATTPTPIFDSSLQMAGSNTNLKKRIRAMETYLNDLRRLRHMRRLSSGIRVMLFLVLTGTLSVCDLVGQANRKVPSFLPRASSLVLEERTISVEDAEQTCQLVGCTGSYFTEDDPSKGARQYDPLRHHPGRGSEIETGNAGIGDSGLVTYPEEDVSSGGDIHSVDGKGTVPIGKIAAMQIDLLTGRSDVTSNLSARKFGSNAPDAEPLYVVDGSLVHDLSGITLNTIESIEIMKEPFATTVYGERGAQGVVQVTTTREREGRASELAAIFGATWVVLSGGN